jgi:hypothetical protein
VPLATVTVRKDKAGTCRIVRICNLGKRRFVMTFGNVGYWFSFVLFPFLKWFRKILETICCRPFAFSKGRTPAPLNAGLLHRAAAPDSEIKAASSVTEKRGFKAFAGRVFANRTRTVSEETLFLGAIGAKDDKQMPFLSETELRNPFYTLMVNRLAGPMLAKLPDNSLDILKDTGTFFKGGLSDVSKAKQPARAETKEISDLKTRITDLEATVEKQSSMIGELRKLVNKEK